MGSSGQLVPWCTIARYLLCFSSKTAVGIQEIHNSHLQKAWLCFRTPRIHVVIFPLGLVVSLPSMDTSHTMRSAVSCDPMSWATCIITCTFCGIIFFPLDLVKTVKLLCPSIWIKTVSVNAEYAAFITQWGLLCILLSFWVWEVWRCNNLSFTLDRKFWYIPNHRISKIFADRADLWIFIEFNLHWINPLMCMCLNKISNIFTTSWPFCLINMILSVGWTHVIFYRISI